MHAYPTPGPSPLHYPTASPGPALDHGPGHIANTLVSSVGGSVLSVAQNIAVLAVPFLLALAVIAWALRKFGMGGSVRLGGAVGMSYYDHDDPSNWDDFGDYNDHDGGRWEPEESDEARRTRQAIAAVHRDRGTSPRRSESEWHDEPVF